MKSILKFSFLFKKRGKTKCNTKFLLVLPFCCLMGAQLNASPLNEGKNKILSSTKQPAIITGNVSGEEGKALPGVNVLIKGTYDGTVSDINGNYSIEIPSKETVLVFSFIGYETLEIPVGSQSKIDVVMKISLSTLDEIVVVGYGTMKKSDLTGSVSSVSSDDFKEQKSTNITEVLKGRMAGVEVSNLSGAPGGDVKIRIRGPNSARSSNNPAIVVDGMIMNINLSDINVNDIENIDVLKDASATAIYGSQGANGVIVITTKRGTGSKPKVEYNTFVSFNQLPKKIDLLNAAEFASLVDSVRNKEIFAPAEIDSFRTYGGTDWQDMVFRTAKTQSHQLSVYGGSEKTNYFLSANYVDEQGILINTYQKKIALRSNINTNVTDKFSTQFNIYVVRKNRHNINDNGSKGGIINQALLWSPTEPVWDNEEEGVYNRLESKPTNGSIHANPFMQAQEKMNDVVSTSALLNGKLSYEIIEGLTIDVFGGLDYNNTKDYNFYNQWINEAEQGSNRQDREWNSWQNSNILTYTRSIHEIHNFTLTGAFELRERTYNQFSASGSDLSTTSVGYYSLQFNNNQGISSDYNRSSQVSYFGRAFYSYRDIILLTGTYRADASSKFGRKNKTDYFPSGALGIRLSEMAFLKNNNLVENLKIRAGYGVTGFDDLEPYNSITLLENVVYSFGSPNAITGLSPGPSRDPNILWEKVSQVNTGIDMAILSSRVSLTMDYYMKTTDRLLLPVDIPGYNGGGTVYKNVGRIKNEGIEVSLNLVPYTTPNFTWDVNFNFSTLKNTIGKLNTDSVAVPRPGILSGILEGDPYIMIEGHSIGDIYGYHYLGPWKSDEEELAAEFNALPGMRKFEDIKQDSTISSDDITVIGNSLPKFIWGANTSLRYKMFNLNIVLQGLLGAEKLNVSYAQAASITSESNSITHRDALNYWTPENENTMWNNPTINRPQVSSLASSQWVQDAGYIKIKNISLSCDIPKRLLKVTDLKISASLQNWITFTKYKGFDPEVTSTGDDDTRPGIDIGSYPSPKSFILGATLTF